VHYRLNLGFLFFFSWEISLLLISYLPSSTQVQAADSTDTSSALHLLLRPLHPGQLTTTVKGAFHHLLLRVQGTNLRRYRRLHADYFANFSFCLSFPYPLSPILSTGRPRFQPLSLSLLWLELSLWMSSLFTFNSWFVLDWSTNLGLLSVHGLCLIVVVYFQFMVCAWLKLL